jgi:hypothetical protein
VKADPIQGEAAVDKKGKEAKLKAKSKLKAKAKKIKKIQQ